MWRRLSNHVRNLEAVQEAPDVFESCTPLWITPIGYLGQNLTLGLFWFPASGKKIFVHIFLENMTLPYTTTVQTGTTKAKIIWIVAVARPLRWKTQLRKICVKHPWRKFSEDYLSPSDMGMFAYSLKWVIGYTDNPKLSDSGTSVMTMLE